MKLVTIRKASEVPEFLCVPRVAVSFIDGQVREVLITDGATTLVVQGQYGVSLLKPEPPKTVKRFVVRGTVLEGAAGLTKDFDTRLEAEEYIVRLNESVLHALDNKLAVSEEEVGEEE